MRQTPPMPEEIEAGFYPGFERGWRRVELVGRTVMAVAVGATLGGLLGGGPVSLWTRTATEGALQVDYAPVVRFGTPTGLTVRTMTSAGQARMTITLPESIVRRYGMQMVFPQPSEWTGGEGGDIRMIFAVPTTGGETTVQVNGLPAGGGLMHLSARLDDGPTVGWSQLVLP